MAEVKIGALRLEVTPGIAKEQPVRLSEHWQAALLRSTKSAPGLTEQHANRLVDALDRAADNDRKLKRATLRDWATTGPLDEAYLLVMAWGLGTTGHLGRGAYWARRALMNQYQHLTSSRMAVDEGVDISGLWKAHFSGQPPTGLGSVAFGSKWLYAVGYGRVHGDVEPLIYDNNIYVALTRLAKLSDYSPPHGRPDTSWRRWCEFASESAANAGGGISPEDVEVALFNYAKTNR